MLFDDDVEPFVGAVVDVLAEHGVRAGSRVLDAGCGTGRYAAALARRGFVVEGIDVSPKLVAYGNEHNILDSHQVNLSVGDLRTAGSAESFDAVVCRGVLNDLLEDAERQAALDRLALVVRPGGVLVLDVRDWSQNGRVGSRTPSLREGCSSR
jgi:2-polyprenyl-3-methyl-5-hydroxy-6-metoxy-1,4-benzoquinol methylase